MKLLSLALLLLCSALAARGDDPGALLNELQKVASKDTTGGDRAALGQFVNAARLAVAREDYAEAEAALQALRSSAFGTDAKNAALLDRIVSALRESVAKRDAAVIRELDAVGADIRAKFAAHAKPQEFDPVFERISRIPVQRFQSYGYPQTGLSSRVEITRNFAARLQDYQVRTAQGNAPQAANALNELLALDSQLPILPRSELLNLQIENDQRIAAMRETRRREFKERYAGLQTRIQERIDNARRASDLDEIMAAISQFRQSMNGPNADFYIETSSLVEPTRRLVSRWQEYLVNLEARNETGAKEVLRSLLNANEFDNIYPRSRILARLYGTSSGPSPGTPVKMPEPSALTLENLDNFAGQFTDAVSEIQSGKFSQERYALQALRKAQSLMRAHDPTAALNALLTSIPTFPAESEYADAFMRIRIEAALQLLPLIFRLPPNMNLQAGETVDGYTRRLLDFSIAKEDWTMAIRIQQAKRSFAPGDIYGNDGSVQLFELLVSASNFERAGQYEQAVRTYTRALQLPNANVPAEVIGRHLDDIRRTHPQEFQEAQRPEAPVYRRGSPVPPPSPGST